LQTGRLWLWDYELALVGGIAIMFCSLRGWCFGR
jgi:hypothetical protein